MRIFAHQGDVPSHCQRCNHRSKNDPREENNMQFIVTVYGGLGVAHFICDECRPVYKMDLEKEYEQIQKEKENINATS